MVRTPLSPMLISSNTLSSFCQDTTKLILTTFTRLSKSAEQKFRVTESTEGCSVHGGWMAVTIAQSRCFRLIFRVNYRDEDVLALALEAYECQEGLTVRQINDFVREYSNQVMGRLKSIIEGHVDDAKSSFTLVTRGEDFSFFAPNPAVPHFADSWLVACDQSIMHCSVSIEFTDASLIDRVQLPAFPDRARSGVVEHFFE